MCAGRALPPPVPAPPPINSAPQGARIERPPRRPARRLLAAPEQGAAPPDPRAAPPRRRAGPRARWAPRLRRGCYLSPMKRGGAQPLLAVTKGMGTPMPLKSPVEALQGLCGPLAARRGRPRQWEGVTAPYGAWGRAPVPGRWPGCRGACAARTRGARCHPVNCVSRETLLQACLQFDSVNLWCYTYTVIYTLYTRS